MKQRGLKRAQLKLKETDNPLVSVICPVYNAIEYFPATLKTILEQTYRNLEIIIVDDESTDGSLNYCLEMQEKDDRIKVYPMKHSGVSAARNYALNMIDGEYVTFVDSDDLVKRCYVNNLISASIRHQQSIVICKSMNGKYASIEEFDQHQVKESPIEEVLDFAKFRFTNKYKHDTVWGGIYKSSLIKKLKFATDLYVGEDTYFFAEALSRAKSLVFVDDVYYYYTYRENSLAHQSESYKLLSEIDAWERVCSLFYNESEEFVNECKTALAFRCTKVYGLLSFSNDADSHSTNDLYIKAKKYLINVLRSKEKGLVYKTVYCFFLLSPRVYDRLMHAANNYKQGKT